MHDAHIIDLRDVSARLRIGVGDVERETPQEVLISVSLTLFDPPRYPDHDRLLDTVDYDAVIGFIQDGLPRLGPMRLIETVADRVAEHCLDLSSRIALVDVTVKKPSVLGAQGLVSVTLRRYGDKSTHRKALFLAEEAGREGALAAGKGVR
jgi:dihydroneopterin aldolase